MRPFARPSRHLLPLTLLLAAACTDAVVNPAVRPPGSGEPGTPVTLQQVACTADVAHLSVSCGLPRTGASTTEIRYGGQNVYVTLAASGVAYNGGTGQFTFTTTLTNLIPQPIGTTDGTTLDPGGVRVFFGSGPVVSAGTGSVSVIPDGFGTFTAAGQAYYQYNQVLAKNATSAGKTWTFIFPPTVGTFDFVVYISSPVEYPNGYVELDGLLPGESLGAMHPGSTYPLTAVVRSALGTALPGVVTFGTSNPGCATVDASGVVTAVQAATCSINATSGALAGSVSFDVTGAGRTWTGAVSTSWATGANWSEGLVPAAVDSATIPAGVPNFPALVASTAIAGVNVADNATLSLGAFDLTASANVATGPTAGSGILSTTGRLVLTASSGTVHGRLPTTVVTGNYALDGDIEAVAVQQVQSGLLVNAGYLYRAVSQ